MLRQNMTEAETRMWSLLRRRHLQGRKFRRQAPIGPYIVDFACLSARLVVEVDDGRHTEHAGADESRTAWLTAQGFRVLRIWSNDVLGNTESVLEMIAQALEEQVRLRNLPSRPDLPSP